MIYIPLSTQNLQISLAAVSNLDAVREINKTLNFFFASCKANSLPIPSVAPVTTKIFKKGLIQLAM